MAEAAKPVVVVRLPEDRRERWRAAAANSGMSLNAFIVAVIDGYIDEGGGSRKLAPAAKKPIRLVRAVVKPEDCTARLQAGAWCKRCQSIHTKGAF